VTGMRLESGAVLCDTGIESEPKGRTYRIRWNFSMSLRFCFYQSYWIWL